MQEPFIVLPCYSLQPNKLVKFNQIYKKTSYDLENNKYFDDGSAHYKRITGGQHGKRLVKQFHNFTISENAYRTLKSKIGWLYHFAKPSYQKTYSGKEIYNFKMAFITLTLPSKQKEPSIDITQKYFNQFLTEIKQRTTFKNYVWRLEFQKNGNVHYHIASDTYLDYFFIQKIWNRIISKGGYVADYQNKHKNMSLAMYANAYNANKKTDFSAIAKRFAKGCANNWLQPNSVDIKSVTSGKMIAQYIAKYFGKNPAGASICNEFDTPQNSKALRLWFCSRGLSKLKSISGFCEEGDPSIWAIIENLKNVRTFVAEYAQMFYFNINTLGYKIRAYYEQIFKDYAIKQGYFNTV